MQLEPTSPMYLNFQLIYCPCSDLDLKMLFSYQDQICPSDISHRLVKLCLIPRHTSSMYMVLEVVNKIYEHTLISFKYLFSVFSLFQMVEV